MTNTEIFKPRCKDETWRHIWPGNMSRPQRHLVRLWYEQLIIQNLQRRHRITRLSNSKLWETGICAFQAKTWWEYIMTLCYVCMVKLQPADIYHCLLSFGQIQVSCVPALPACYAKLTISWLQLQTIGCFWRLSWTNSSFQLSCVPVVFTLMPATSWAVVHTSPDSTLHDSTVISSFHFNFTVVWDVLCHHSLVDMTN